MTEPFVGERRRSAAVRNSFVITGVTAFGIVGYFVGFWVAGLIVPDAASFYRGAEGSIVTARLHGFYALWGLGVCAAGVVGAIVGRGFYVAWQER